MDPPPAPTSRPTHIPLPPPPSFSAFLSTPSPSQRDDPFSEDAHSPYLQFYTAPSTPYSEAEPPEPPSPLADYFTPPCSPFTELPVTVPSPTPPPVPGIQVSTRAPSPPPSVPLVVPHPANTYVSPSPYGTDDIYPGFPVDIVNDLILDDGSLTALEKIYLFCRSKQVVHRSYIVKNMPKLLQDVAPQEAVEYVLPLFRELVLDPDETVQEEFSRSLADVMWWFLTHCQVVADYTWEGGGDNLLPPAQIHLQTFTPLFGTLILSSNGNVSETARCSVNTVLERIKKADDHDMIARGEEVRPPLPPENLWKAPAPDYAIDDLEIVEEDPEIGLFGSKERVLVKQEILSSIVIALGRLDTQWEDVQMEESVESAGQNLEDRRSWLEAQNGDGVQVVSPGEQGNGENGVTTSTDLDASTSNPIAKEDTINPYFPIVPSSFPLPSSTSSTPSTGNSSNSSSDSSPTVPAPGVTSNDALFDPLLTSEMSGSIDSTRLIDSEVHSEDSPTSKDVLAAQDTFARLHNWNAGASTSASDSSQSYQPPAYLRPLSQSCPRGPLAYQLNLGHMIHEEEEDIYYDEQATNGRWSTMRLVAAVATSGTSDLETEIYLIRDVERSVKDPVYWVRREAAFAVGALARVVPVEYVVRDLVPLFKRLVADPHPDVRQNVLFSLPPLVQRLPFEQRRDVTYQTLTALAEDPEITVRESALDTLSETIYAFVDGPQGPPEFLMHMFLGRKEDRNVRNGTRLITFEIPPPLEAFYLDTKRPLTLAFGFPAVTMALGRQRWGELREAYLDLAANRMNDVKRSLAAGLGEIAKVIGVENARQDLVNVWWNSLNCKDSQTRIRAIENLATFIGVVGNELGLSFWAGVLKNWQSGIFTGWRERKIILLELVKIAEILGADILPVVKGIVTQALLDPEQGVRDIVIGGLPKILGLLVPRKDLLDDLNIAITQLVSSTFRRRMTFASCQRSIFLASVESGQKPSVALSDDMLRAIYELSNDRVTDVRICVARFVGSVCDRFIRESDPIPELLSEVVGRLSQDSSLSVKTFVPDPISLFSGNLVVFPPSGEVVETILALPTRSRHFSKPPLPHRASSISSAADLADAENGLTRVGIIGADTMVGRSYGGQGDAQYDHQGHGAAATQARAFESDTGQSHLSAQSTTISVDTNPLGQMDIDNGERAAK